MRHFIFLAVLFCPCASAEANAFLSAHSRGHLARETVEQALGLEMPGGADAKRLQSTMEELAPLFRSLPKDEQGRLAPSTVRYALHRFFAEKHGWYLKGLAPGGEGWKFASTSGDMQSWLPGYIFSLLNERLHGQGLDLADLASFAVTLSDIIQGEAVGGLESVYAALELSMGEEVSNDDFDLAVRGYLSEVIVWGDEVVTSRAHINRLEHVAKSQYPEYDDIRMWAQDLRMNRQWGDSSRRNPFVEKGISFDMAVDLLGDILHSFSESTKLECSTLKEQMMAMEVAGSGRFPLSSFYANRNLQIYESPEYLRALGVVQDEGAQPTFMISNYMNSPSRCMPFSSYFNVCCFDQCESLTSQVERAVGAPLATPDRLVEVISSLPSDTVDAPRNLTQIMVSRLMDIANHHAGKVPLHGRLFMQWMHYNYPRECSFPHVSGTTNPMTQDDWLYMNPELEDAMVSRHDYRQQVAGHKEANPAHFSIEALAWSTEEEMIGKHVFEGSAKSRLREIMAVLALASALVPAVGAFRKFAMQEQKERHVCV